jgi:pimeloyl-ACP methyl ester carboxylesterase
MPRSPESFYAGAVVERRAVDDATLAMRRFGSGPPLVFVHGFPVHGATWRWLLPALAERFECVVVDLPGLGDGDWNAASDLRFSGHARRLRALLAELGLAGVGVVAHDTGATVARHLALQAPDRVAALALLNTEIPGHRPPWIPLYQSLTRVPGSAATFRLLLRSQAFLRSGMGFREFYSDKRLFDDPTRLAPYVDPIVGSARRTEGMLRYLGGLAWDEVDALRTRHAELKMPVLFLWGEDDRTFPVDRAEPMTKQLGGPVRFVRIPRASLMPHEERPDFVLEQLVPFLAENTHR